MVARAATVCNALFRKDFAASPGLFCGAAGAIREQTSGSLGMSAVFLAIFLVALLSAYRYNKDIFSPARLLICVYALLFFLDSLHLSGYQRHWSATTHLLLWGALAFFLAGSLIVVAVNGIRNPLVKTDFGSMRAALRDDAATLDWNWFYLVFCIAAGIFMSSYLTSFLITGQIPVFSDPASADNARIRFFGASLPSNMGLFFGPICLILGTELMLFGAAQKRRTIIVALVSLATLLLYITLITRLDLFRYMFFAVIIFHYGKRRLTLPNLLSAAGFFAVAFLLFFLLRVRYDTWGVWAEAQKFHMPKELLWCANMYTYAVNNFWNFDFAVRKYIDGVAYYPMQWGFSLLRPFLSLAHLEAIFENGYGFDTILNESVSMIKSLNTIVFPWHFYKDFGVFGVYFLPLVIGMATTVFYVNTMNAPSLLRVAIWAQVAPLIVFSYSFALWEFWFIYVNLAVIAAAHRRL